MSTTQTQYRPEIDGLRTIAVLSVIIYHAQFNFLQKTPLPGGFLGVDIFFVISGYLISKIIIGEMNSSGSFDLRFFYERRARRILPMLFTVMLVSYPLAWAKLFPDGFIEFSQSILSALAFASNFFFYFKATEYDAGSALLKPFLHTWSLGIEEQFYLVFPLVFFLSFRYLRPYIFTIFLLVAMTSLHLAFSGNKKLENFEIFSFYLPFTRIWELIAGFLVAQYEANNGRVKSEFLASWCPLIGLYLIYYSIVHFDKGNHHAGLFTVLSVVGAALIISFSNEKELVGKVLGSRGFVFFGLISYSLYLWHYPIMAFGRLHDANPSNRDKVYWIALTLILSILSYFFIEKPFRNKRVIGSRRFLAVTLIVGGLIVAIHSTTILLAGFPSRFPSFVNRATFDDRFKHQADYSRCHLREVRARRKPVYFDDSPNFCVWGNHPKNAYLVGDSHTFAIANNLYSKLDKTGANLVVMTGPGSILGRKEFIDRFRLPWLEKISNEVVIVGGYYHRENSEFFSKNRQSYQNLFDLLERNNNKVVLIYPVPSTDINREHLYDAYKANGNKLPDRSSPRSEFDRQSKEAYAFLDSFVNKNISRVYPSDFLCSQDKCFGIKDDKILISDSDHPSSITADWLNEQIMRKISNDR